MGGLQTRQGVKIQTRMCKQSQSPGAYQLLSMGIARCPGPQGGPQVRQLAWKTLKVGARCLLSSCPSRTITKLKTCKLSRVYRGHRQGLLNDGSEVEVYCDVRLLVIYGQRFS